MELSILIKPSLLSAVLDQTVESVESAMHLLMGSTETDDFIIAPFAAMEAVKSILDGNFFFRSEWVEVFLAREKNTLDHLSSIELLLVSNIGMARKLILLREELSTFISQEKL